MILSFACNITESLYEGGRIKRKDLNKFGNLNWEDAVEKLSILNEATEEDLINYPPFKYHVFQDGRASLDVKSGGRGRGKWRIIFEWQKDDNRQILPEKQNVELVRISNESH